MTDTARRVCGGGWGWPLSVCALEFLNDMKSADSGREASASWELQRELGVLLLGWPASRRAMLDLSQGGVNEISLARTSLDEAESEVTATTPMIVTRMKSAQSARGVMRGEPGHRRAARH